MPFQRDVDEIQQQRLRLENYNANVISIRRAHDELMIMRVRPDSGVPSFQAGQYTVLGLGYWEPRVAHCQSEGDVSQVYRKLIKRAYSVSCPILSDTGNVVGVHDVDFLEFYISLIRRAQEHPPALTPRLFALDTGARIFCSSQFHGRYGLDAISPTANIVFAATGTGEAPHNAMVAELLASGHQGQIANVVCVRRDGDLSYLAIHQRIETIHPNYRYITLTTREPRNLDASRADYVGKQYLQEYFSSNALMAETGMNLDPTKTHVFLCGHPDMIGVPQRTHGASRRYPEPKGMVETLENLGFEIDRPHERGNIHFEKYW